MGTAVWAEADRTLESKKMDRTARQSEDNGLPLGGDKRISKRGKMQEWGQKSSEKTVKMSGRGKESLSGAFYAWPRFESSAQDGFESYRQRGGSLANARDRRFYLRRSYADIRVFLRKV